VSARIPDKLYFKIGEVAEIAGVEPYVLRFWESEFPVLAPRKAESGHRVYRRKDVETVIRIRDLLYEKGYTIAGARRRLNPRRQDGAEERQEDTLERVRASLEDILTLLDDRT
jgi:DNA-binding transcriptional MerR regulator